MSINIRVRDAIFKEVSNMEWIPTTKSLKSCDLQICFPLVSKCTKFDSIELKTFSNFKWKKCFQFLITHPGQEVTEKLSFERFFRCYLPCPAHQKTEIFLWQPVFPIFDSFAFISIWFFLRLVFIDSFDLGTSFRKIKINDFFLSVTSFWYFIFKT